MGAHVLVLTPLEKSVDGLERAFRILLFLRGLTQPGRLEKVPLRLVLENTMVESSLDTLAHARGLGIWAWNDVGVDRGSEMLSRFREDFL